MEHISTFKHAYVPTSVKWEKNYVKKNLKLVTISGHKIAKLTELVGK